MRINYIMTFTFLRKQKSKEILILEAGRFSDLGYFSDYFAGEF